MDLSFLKNKKVLMVAGISVGVLILIVILSPKNNSDTSTQPPLASAIPRPELIDLSKEKRNQAMIYVDSIESKLPLYLKNFETSVGITTSINVYRVKGDEPEVVRLEIYGLSYLNRETDESKNPNVTAFKESYQKAMEMIEGQNIDPKKLIFIYGDKEYVRITSQVWLDSLKLHP